MTHRFARLWDNHFRYLGGERIPYREISVVGRNIEVKHRGGSQLLGIARNYLANDPETNLHITVDPNPDDPDWHYRIGGIVTTIDIDEHKCECAHSTTITTLTINAEMRTGELVHRYTATPETIHPPRGYGIGLLRGGNAQDVIVGCWATEDEARQALTEMHIVTLGGAPAGGEQ